MNKTLPSFPRRTFLVAGGDLRSVYLGEKLAENDTVYSIGLDNNVLSAGAVIPVDTLISLPKRVDCLVLPLPVSTDDVMINCPYSKTTLSLTTLISTVKENGIVFGGKISPAVRKLFERCNLTVIDYLDREELSVMNAVPTAEGAIQIAMEEMAETIYDRKVLITGMGRISKVLIKILVGMGAKVTASARKYSDLSWAEIYGCESVHIQKLDDLLSEFDLVFNTVPAMVLDKKRLQSLKSSCLVIDLASKPGGVDFEAAGDSGVKTIWALSLPGKTAPVTSGQMIALAIQNILEERGDSQ